MNQIHRILLSLHRKTARPYLGRPRLIVIFGIMRSGTSVLTNVLTNNTKISGFGESHIRYTDESTLLDLKYWIFRFTKQYPRKHMFLLDKVLHGTHIPDLARLMDWVDLYPIFMLREPFANACSLQKVFANTDGAAGLPWDYLLYRYAQLDALVDALGEGRPISTISYDALTENSDACLAGLSRQLDIDPPILPEYGVPSYVGRWGLGDGSSHIRSGVIVAQKKRFGPRKDNVPTEVSNAYDSLCVKLRVISGFYEV